MGDAMDFSLLGYSKLLLWHAIVRADSVESSQWHTV